MTSQLTGKCQSSDSKRHMSSKGETFCGDPTHESWRMVAKKDNYKIM